MRAYACAVLACCTASVVCGIPASIEVGAIRNMAVPATTTAQLGDTQKLRKGVGLMGSHLQHSYGIAVPYCGTTCRSAWLRAAVAWGLAGSSLHGPL